MAIPLITGYKQLDTAPRRFLIYVAINVVSWQNIVGPAMILLARKIEMPESLVGLLISFMPFTTLLLLVTLPLIVRLGPKKVMLWAWFLRNVIVCVIFLMPFALATHNKTLAWAVLLIAILGFCVMRAIGAGGWLPWLHEIVPPTSRSIYFSTETSITQLINVVVMFIQARLLAVEEPGLSRFLCIYALGVGMGFASLFWMYRIPGGEGGGKTNARIGLQAYTRALTDRHFLVFLYITTFSLMGMVWFGASNIMYLRDVVGVADSMTMTLAALGSLGILVTVNAWARFTDARGSGLTMAKTLFGHACAPLLMLATGIYSSGTYLLIGSSVVLASVFSAAFHVAANRAMLNQVPDYDRVGYTALWTVSTSLALGITPVIAGALIEWYGLLGFRLCFCLSIIFTTAGALMCLFFVHDIGTSGRHWSYLLNPVLPLRTAGRILWITLGLHESNRKVEGEKAVTRSEIRQ